jgi:hypothetical protein
LLLVKREIFSLLVFGGQYVLKEIGFVSAISPFLPEDSSRRNRADFGGGWGRVDGSDKPDGGRQRNSAERERYDALKHQTFGHFTMVVGGIGR